MKGKMNTQKDSLIHREKNRVRIYVYSTIQCYKIKLLDSPKPVRGVKRFKSNAKLPFDNKKLKWSASTARDKAKFATFERIGKDTPAWHANCEANFALFVRLKRF